MVSCANSRVLFRGNRVEWGGYTSTDMRALRIDYLLKFILIGEAHGRSLDLFLTTEWGKAGWFTSPPAR